MANSLLIKGDLKSSIQLVESKKLLVSLQEYNSKNLEVSILGPKKRFWSSPFIKGPLVLLTRIRSTEVFGQQFLVI